MSDSRRYLVVGPAWVGDMVMAQALFKFLRQREPDAVIDVLAPAWSAPLIARMPEVRRSVTVPLGHGQLGLATRYRIGRELAGEGYDRAIALPRSLKAALIPFFAQIKQRTGYRGEMRYGLLNDIRPLDKQLLKMVVQRYVALGLDADEPLPPKPVPRPSLGIDKQNQQRLLGSLALSLDTPVVGFMPGAEYGPAKQWPIEYYGRLAMQLEQAGYQVWQFGSQKDVSVAEQIDEASGGKTTVLCGKTRLEDAIDLIALTQAVVSNDSGLMHVAAALDVPLVALYGSSTPDYTPPLNDNASVLYLGLACSPCFKRRCPYGHTDCLTGIDVEQVYNALMQITGKNSE